MICYLFTAPEYLIFSADVPQLLYYSHIPVAVISILIGFFVFWNNKNLLLNRLLFAISACFSLWIFLNLILWTNVHSDLILFAWSFLRIFSSLISILCVYFTYVFLEKKDISNWVKGIFLLLIIPVILLAPTNINISGLDLVNCDAFMFEGILFQFYRVAFGILAMIWILVLLVRKYYIAEYNFRKQILLMGIGLESFLFSFFVVIFLAAYLTDKGILVDSRIEFYGLFGMVVLMSFITFLIVRFNTFQVKVLGTQALLIAQGALIGSLLFIQDINYIRIIISLSLIVFLVLAIMVVRGVRKEVAQREKIEKQEKELEIVNQHLKDLDQQKTEFVSFASHQLRSPLTAIKGYASLILDGDYGSVPDELKKAAQIIFDSTKNLAVVVDDYLNVSRIELGQMKYNFAECDLKDVVQGVVNELKPNVEKAGLELQYNVKDGGDYHAIADKDKLIQVFANVIDNSVKYTPKGKIIITLENKGNKIRFSVKDTGIGITKDIIPKLFTKFKRAGNANKTNIHGTGLGLYIAKEVVTAHKGKIWVESEGEGKGSEFIVELPKN